MKISHILLLPFLFLSPSSYSGVLTDKVGTSSMNNALIKDDKNDVLGLKMGLGYSDLEGLFEKISIIPKPNDNMQEVVARGLLNDFELINDNTLYYLNISSKSGLCSFLALNNIKYDIDEKAKVENIYLDIEKKIESNYGKSHSKKAWILPWMKSPNIWQLNNERADMMEYKEWSNFENNDLSKIIININHKRPANKDIKERLAQVGIYFEFENYNDDCKARLSLK